jgi:hypothetical protein
MMHIDNLIPKSDSPVLHRFFFLSEVSTITWNTIGMYREKNLVANLFPLRKNLIWRAKLDLVVDTKFNLILKLV